MTDYNKYSYYKRMSKTYVADSLWESQFYHIIELKWQQMHVLVIQQTLEIWVEVELHSKEIYE